MRRILSSLAAVAFAAAALYAVAPPAAAGPEGNLTIDKPAAVWPAKRLKEGAKTKGPVTFNHGKHGTSLGCVLCHHKEPDLKAGATQAASCFTCHGPEAVTGEGGKVKPDSWIVIHDKKAGRCIACHSTDEKAKLAKAPTSCKACHGGSE